MGMIGLGNFPPQGSLLDIWSDWIIYRGVENPPVWVPKAPQTREEMVSWTPSKMVGVSWEGYQKDVKRFFEEQDKRNQRWGDDSRLVVVVGVVVLLALVLIISRR